MSDVIPFPGAPSADTTTPSASEPVSTSSPPPPPPPPLPPIFELISRGLAVEADEAARESAREAWAAYLPVASASLPVLARALAGDASIERASAAPPAPAAAPLGPHAPVAALPPSNPITAAARVLSSMPPEQLIDLVIQRIRAVLPQGTEVAAPRGFQVPLVPVPPVPGRK